MLTDAPAGPLCPPCRMLVLSHLMMLLALAEPVAMIVIFAKE
jgi:hypothetical protein